MNNQGIKPEIRNPKSEPSPNSEIRICRVFPRHSDFRFDSDFGPTSLIRRNSGFRPRAFTLIEMITVLTIIIIVLLIAVPVWKALLGGTNLSTAQNTVAATLANARADAIYNRQTIGVFFYTDPKTQQTAMAEVQVQTLYQPHPSTGTGPIYTSSFQPGYWNGGSWSGNPNSNGAIYSIELVNSTDPTSGNITFYRDPVLLPKGVAVALNNNTLNNNPYGQWNGASNTNPPLDRYLRNGCIMFNPDGTLASIPLGIPYYEWFNSTSYTSTGTSPGPAQENQICSKIGMYNGYDLASNLSAAPTNIPLTSSVGLVIYDHDAYLNQHATATTVVTTADGAQFSDADLDYYLPPTSGWTQLQQSNNTSGFAADKFLEEQWIDQNGTAMLVSPFNGSLIKAK